MLPLFNNTTHLDKIPIRVSTEAVRIKDNFHFHRHMQLCFVLSGELRHTICEKEYIQHPGSCAFILPYTPHRLDATISEDTPLIIHIWFRESFLKEHRYRFSAYGEYANFNGHEIPVVCDFPKHGALPTQIIHKIINEFAQEKKLSFSKIADLIAELFSFACTKPIVKKSGSMFKRQLTGVEAAINYIENHFQEKLSLDDLCEVSGMSRRSFTEHFRRITKLTPLHYILSVRLQTAFNLIMNTNIPFNEIAHSSGLRNNANLARVFAKNLRASPSQFVENYIRNTTFSHAQSTYTRDKWLYELQSHFNDKE